MSRGKDADKTKGLDYYSKVLLKLVMLFVVLGLLGVLVFAALPKRAKLATLNSAEELYHKARLYGAEEKYRFEFVNREGSTFLYVQTASQYPSGGYEIAHSVSVENSVVEVELGAVSAPGPSEVVTAAFSSASFSEELTLDDGDYELIFRASRSRRDVYQLRVSGESVEISGWGWRKYVYCVG